MSTGPKTPWRISGYEVGSCNCAWGCPCQFNALPTHGRCEGLAGCHIREGYFGSTRLDGVRFVQLLWWPGAVHEGNGIRQLIVDQRATPAQRAALIALESGTQGGAYFEIFAVVCPNELEPAFAPITLEADRERREARLIIPGIVESQIEPIRNPVTGEEHRARIVLPNGFEFQEAEMANSVYFSVESGSLVFQHTNTYGQLCEFDWSNR